MPSLSENDPEPAGRSRPPTWLIAAIAALIVAIVALHLTGVVGPG
jgi:hypothetical protein